MKHKLLLAAASVAMLAAPAMAFANDDDSGIYVRGNTGYGLHTDADLTGDIIGDVESEGGLAGSAGIGYDFGNNWRLEGDYASLFTDLGAIGQAPSSVAKLNTNSYMVNALYDFDMDALGKFEPYVGAGIGLVQGQLKAQAHSFTGEQGNFINTPACLGGDFACAVKDTDSSLGWQLLAGLGYDISDNLTWDTHYRYLNAGDMDFTGHKNFGGVANVNYEDVAAHSVMTGLRYKFGGSTPKVMYSCWNGNKVEDLSTCAKRPAPPPKPIMYSCWDGMQVTDRSQCSVQPAPEPAPQTYSCWDGSLVYDLSTCPVQPAPQPVQQSFLCSDGVTGVTDLSQCPVVQMASTYNNCGPSNVAIFNVPVNTTPKQMPRLGTLPEFGDSHGLSSSQFFDKLSTRYASNATDRAYLNYLFKSMGYAGGFKDANASMISETVLPVGTSGLLGLGEQHHYNYSVLPSNDRDRQAFLIQSANGSVIHFMKTCGNYFYACN